MSEPSALVFAKTVEIDLLLAEERYEDAVGAGRAWLESHAGEDRGLRAEVHAQVADALWLGERNAEIVEIELSRALALDNSNPRTARVLREVRGERSPAASMWRLLIQGAVRGLDAGDKLGFFTTYFVVAEDPEQALRFVERFEPDEYHTDLKIAEAEAIEPAGDSLLGVYEQRGGYSAFTPE